MDFLEVEVAYTRVDSLLGRIDVNVVFSPSYLCT
jgi:hypothetical protein